MRLTRPLIGVTFSKSFERITSHRQRAVALFFAVMMVATTLIPAGQVYAEATLQDSIEKDSVEVDKPMKQLPVKALPTKELTSKPAADARLSTDNLGGLFGTANLNGPAPASTEGLQTPGSNGGEGTEAGELIDKRTRSSQSFRQANGKLKVRQYTTPRFYQKDGQWTDINLDLEEDKNSGDSENPLGEVWGVTRTAVTSPDAYKVKGNGWIARFAASHKPWFASKKATDKWVSRQSMPKLASRQ